MPLDPNILREAREVLQLYATPAQELIKQNSYGPRKARLAGAIVANSFTVVSYEKPTETELLRDLKVSAWEQISKLCNLLRQATEVIEEYAAGHTVLLQECEQEIATAEEDFEVDDIDEVETPQRDVYVVVFPALGAEAATADIDDFVDKLKVRGVKTWIADENDQSKRLKAMTMREIYNVGRIASVVVASEDGLVLDGWYNGLPWVEEVLSKIQELR